MSVVKGHTRLSLLLFDLLGVGGDDFPLTNTELGSVSPYHLATLQTSPLYSSVCGGLTPLLQPALLFLSPRIHSHRRGTTHLTQIAACMLMMLMGGLAAYWAVYSLGADSLDAQHEVQVILWSDLLYFLKLPITVSLVLRLRI